MLKDSGRLAEAEAAYRQVLAQTPLDAEIHLQLGHVLKLQRKRNEALLPHDGATSALIQSCSGLLQGAGGPKNLDRSLE